MLRTLLVLLAACWLGATAHGQKGKLLLIGGGSEKDSPNSWNQAAYKWAVQQGANKKVAIIAFGSSDSWLPNYFVNRCGAAAATNFDISSATTANDPATYDALVAYDVVFLKGGDQADYYETYRGTQTQAAIEAIYARGGVVCGTSAGLAILSGVVYTAQKGSAISAETLANPKHYTITLKDDFFGFMPGYLFDSHFTIRSRFGRLLAFMANWVWDKGQSLQGIGVDEMTALAIDQYDQGRVYGIGSVNFYRAYSDTTFRLSGQKLVADSVHVHQLVQGCSIDLRTGFIQGFGQKTQPEPMPATGLSELMLSGSDNLGSNAEFLAEFVTQRGASTDPILVLTGTDQALANSYAAELARLGAPQPSIFAALPDQSANTALQQALASARKILLVGTAYTQLMDFVASAGAGTAVWSKMKQPGIAVAFVGDNARFAAQTVVANYLNPDAAYYGELKTQPGLGLLPSCVVVPNAYLSADVYENTAAAVPYAMVTNNLRYGIWLSQGTYLSYRPGADQMGYLHARGNSPVLLLRNTGTASGLSQQTAYGDGKNANPNFAGFEHMTLSLIDPSRPYRISDQVANTALAVPSVRGSAIELRFDGQLLQLHHPHQAYTLRLIDTTGRCLMQHQSQGTQQINLSHLPAGCYQAHVQTQRGDDRLVRTIVLP